ncbi:Ubiquitin carboxyl-terminal hydrolase 34 [Pelomyxa schiedti]|nr:Ubiquitin carboxyl-terminal hydrolase 34 [Pelomyxa schiedti]
MPYNRFVPVRFPQHAEGGASTAGNSSSVHGPHGGMGAAPTREGRGEGGATAPPPPRAEHHYREARALARERERAPGHVVDQDDEDEDEEDAAVSGVGGEGRGHEAHRDGGPDQEQEGEGDVGDPEGAVVLPLKRHSNRSCSSCWQTAQKHPRGGEPAAARGGTGSMPAAARGGSVAVLPAPPKWAKKTPTIIGELPPSSKEALDDSILYQVQLLFGGLMKSGRECIDPRGLCNALRKSGIPIDLSRQMDVDEFFTQLRDGLTAEIKAANNSDILHECFGGKQCQRIKCKVCEKTSDQHWPFYALQLEVRDMATTAVSLSKYFSLANISVNENEVEGGTGYQCNTCNKLVDALKGYSLEEFPATLILHCEWFTSSGKKQMKLHDEFKVPMELDMAPFTTKDSLCLRGLWDTKAAHSTAAAVAEEEASTTTSPVGIHVPGAVLYRLVGVIVHSGDTPNEGHYYSIIREQDSSQGNWLLFNDNTVKPFNIAELSETCFGGWKETTNGMFIPRDTAYILFYEKCGSTQEEELQQPQVSNSGVKIPETINSRIEEDNAYTLQLSNNTDAAYMGFVKFLVTAAAKSETPNCLNTSNPEMGLGTLHLIDLVLTLVHPAQVKELVKQGKQSWCSQYFKFIFDFAADGLDEKGRRIFCGRQTVQMLFSMSGQLGSDPQGDFVYLFALEALMSHPTAVVKKKFLVNLLSSLGPKISADDVKHIVRCLCKGSETATAAVIEFMAQAIGTASGEIFNTCLDTLEGITTAGGITESDRTLSLVLVSSVILPTLFLNTQHEENTARLLRMLTHIMEVDTKARLHLWPSDGPDPVLALLDSSYSTDVRNAAAEFFKKASVTENNGVVSHLGTRPQCALHKLEEREKLGQVTAPPEATGKDPLNDLKLFLRRATTVQQQCSSSPSPPATTSTTTTL